MFSLWLSEGFNGTENYYIWQKQSVSQFSAMSTEPEHVFEQFMCFKYMLNEQEQGAVWQMFFNTKRFSAVVTFLSFSMIADKVW